MMKRIGFSHNYPKLHGQGQAQLLQCVSIRRCEMDDDAVAYDTEYWADNEKRYFRLDDGDYLRLTLMGDKGIPFTTYRKNNDDNRAKYLGAVGEWFEIFVKEM